MPKIRHIRLNMLCCDRYVRAVKSIKRLRTHTRTIRIRIFNVDALVSAILTVFYFSSFLFIYLYLLGSEKCHNNTILVAAYIVVAHEEKEEGKNDSLSV